MPDSGLPENAVKLPVATCNGCGASADLVTDEHRADPGSAVTCAADGGCTDRTLTITAFAHISGQAGQ